MSVLQKSTNPFNVPNRNFLTFAGWVSCLFLTLSCIGMLNHEMWRDELQAWLLATETSSLNELFSYLRYEGHPGLWHVCLFILSRVVPHVGAMQAFHGLIAAIAVYVVTRFAPFSKTHTLLFIFGYFPFFEYNLLSRNYSLGFLFIFLFCSAFAAKRRNYWLLFALLALTVHTNVYALMLAFFLALTLVVEGLISGDFVREWPDCKPAVMGGGLLFGVSLAIALYQIIPPPSASFQGAVAQFNSSSNFGVPEPIRQLIYGTLTLWRSYIPIPNPADPEFWNTNILLESSGLLKLMALALSLGLVGLASILMLKTPSALFFYLGTTSALVMFTSFKYFGEIRHHGHLFMVLIISLWLSHCCVRSEYVTHLIPRLPSVVSLNTKRLSSSPDRWLYRPYLTTLLVIHVFVGLLFFGTDLTQPFSPAKATAQYIRRQNLNTDLVIASQDHITMGVSAFLNQELYYPERGTFGSFAAWNERGNANDAKILADTHRLITERGTDALLILTSEMAIARPDLTLEKLASFEQGIVKYEKFHLYRAKAAPVNEPT